MKFLSVTVALTGLLCLTACREAGQGTPGSSMVETGMGLSDNNSTYPLASGDVFGHAGFPDAAVAQSRAGAGLDESATGGFRGIDSSGIPGPSPKAPGVSRSQEPDRDQILLERVQSALNSSGPNASATTRPLSNGELANLRITVNNGVVTLLGTADSLQEKNDIETRVRGVEGVAAVHNDLRVVSPQPVPNP